MSGSNLINSINGIMSPSTRVLLASILGSAPPIVGSYLTTDNDGWLGTPAAALAGIRSALADACAFNAALLAAISGFRDADVSSIDKLMSSLECRRSTYIDLSGGLSNSMNHTGGLVNSLNNLLRLMESGKYGDICKGC
mgnify:FL=1